MNGDTRVKSTRIACYKPLPTNRCASMDQATLLSLRHNGELGSNHVIRSIDLSNSIVLAPAARSGLRLLYVVHVVFLLHCAHRIYNSIHIKENGERTSYRIHVTWTLFALCQIHGIVLLLNERIYYGNHWRSPEISEMEWKSALWVWWIDYSLNIFQST